MTRADLIHSRPAMVFYEGDGDYFVEAIEKIHSWADALNEPASDRPKALRLGYAITGALQSEMV